MLTVSASAVDVVVFRRDSRPLYLVLHGPPHTRHAGTWRVVTGELIEGESPLQAAIRALQARTGLSPVDIWCLDYLHTFYDFQTNQICLTPTFAIEVAEKNVLLSDVHDDARWITFEQANELLTWPGHREGLHITHEDIVTSPRRGAAFRVLTDDRTRTT